MPKKKKVSAAKGRNKEPLPRVQRKIFHLLDSEGQGDTFKYYNKISRKSGFVEGQSVYLSSKWDGTTVQATCNGVYKRVDKIKKGDPKKHAAKEEDRYDIREVSTPGDKYIQRAMQEYEDVFPTLHKGLCVYFEACHYSIGSRFRDTYNDEWSTIRVFDFSRDGEFLPFDETVALAQEYSLPLVEYEETDLSVANLIDRLSSDQFNYEGDGCDMIPCEGFVVRGIGEAVNVAKIRVEDVPKIVEAHY